MWTVWGDGTDPIATDLAEDRMRELVDADTTGALYGEDTDGETYEGPEG